jgi:site-specific recombinase XerD
MVVREYGRKDTYIKLGQVNRKTAELRRGKVLEELLNGTYNGTPFERLFFDVFCDKFIADFAQGARAPSTVALYRERLKAARQKFQGYFLDQIRREDVERFIGGLRSGNRHKNITLSVLRLLFQKAVEWRYLRASPAHSIRRWTEEKGGSRSLTETELGKLLCQASPWQKAVLQVMVSTGMRSGELSHLKFQDINWDDHTLKIVSEHDRKTKNRKSRTIPMTTDLEDILKFLWESWPNMQYGNGSTQLAYLPRTDIQREYVFCHKDGRSIGIFRSSMKKLFKKADIQGVTMHGLRKTFCSMLARHGAHPKEAQTLLGHADVRLTMEIYTEVQTDQLRKAVDRLPSMNSLQRPQLRVVNGSF